MPLKLKDISHPASTTLINKWADEKEQQLKQLTEMVKKLQNQGTS